MHTNEDGGKGGKAGWRKGGGSLPPRRIPSLLGGGVPSLAGRRDTTDFSGGGRRISALFVWRGEDPSSPVGPLPPSGRGGGFPPPVSGRGRSLPFSVGSTRILPP